MIRRAALATALVAGPAVADGDAAPCGLVFETHAVITPAQAEAVPGAVYDVHPEPVSGDRVATRAMTRDGGAIQVLTHCPTGDFMVLRVYEAEVGAVLARFDEMIADGAAHSPIEITDAAMRLGALSRMGKGGIGGCDCAAAYGN